MYSGLNMLRRISQIRLFSTAADKDVNSLTLFVSNLPWTVSKGELQQYFSQFGPLSGADVAFDQRGLSRGFGHVTFKYSKSYVKALQTEHHMLEGKSLEVTQSKYSRST